MTRLTSRTRLAVALLTASALCLSGEVTAGKPGGGGTTTLPPVRYQLHFVSAPSGGSAMVMYDMNNAGEMVGSFVDAAGVKRAFLARPLAAAQAIDLSTTVTAPAGWTIACATSINDSGLIVGYLEPQGSPNDPNSRAAFVIDPDVTPLTATRLPSAMAYTVAVSVNEQGDILSAYRKSNGTWGVTLYNPLVDLTPTELPFDCYAPNFLVLNNSTSTRDVQVAGLLADQSAFRWTRGGPLEVILPAPASGPGSAVYGINNTGTVCGYTYIKVSRTRTEQRPMRYAAALEILPAGYYSAGAINGAGDVTLGTAIYRDDWGALNIDQLIDRTDPDSALWFSTSRKFYAVTKITERLSGTNFAACGAGVDYGDGTGTRYCLLTPVAAP
jgi:hypothetical protein